MTAAITKAIGAELDRFGEYYTNTFTSHIPLLDRVFKYIIQQKGKQLRPALVLLCARLGGAINEKTYRAALFVEMLHTSSLVHDDLVDNSMKRRNAFSINALWKERGAVLTGDNIFTKSILLLLDNDDHEVLKIFSQAIRRVIEGELLQLDKSRKLNLDEAVYFDIIKNKTATLLAAACAAGAATTFENNIDTLYQFGEKTGIAFQIKDDILDYGSDDIGKPTGNDIQEKKMTLPLIYTINTASAMERKRLINIIKHKNGNGQMTSYIIDAVKQAGGIAYASEKMLTYSNEALQLLHTFSPSDTRYAMEELVQFVTNRTH